MADFGQTQVQDIPLDVRPHEGVSDKSGAIALQGVANAISGFGSALRGARQHRQAQLQTGVMNQYRQQLIVLADGVEQGRITSREAKTKSRALFSQYSTDYPSLSSDIAKIHKETMATPGLGQVITEGTPEEQRRMKNIDKAMQEGFISSSDSEEQIQIGLDLYEESVSIERDWEHQGKRIDNILKNRQLTQAEKEDALQAQKDESSRLIGKSTDFWFRRTQKELESIVQGFQETGDPTEALNQINLLQANTQREINGFKVGPAGLDKAYVDNMTKPIMDLIDTYKGMVSGGETLEAIQNQVKILQAKTQLNQLGDPEIAALSAISKLIGESVIVSLSGERKAEELLSSILDPTNVVQLGKPQDRQVSTKVGRELSSKYKDASPEAKQEIDNYNNSLLDSIDANQSMFEREGVKALSDMFNYFASSEFEEYVINGGKLTQKNLTSATAVIEKVYNDSLKGLLEEKFTNAKFSVLGVQTTGLTNENVTNVITLGAENGVVKFSVNEDSIKLPRDREEAMLYADRLNKEVAPALQNVVRGYTLLSGTTDYQGTWDTLVSKILPEGSIPQEPVQGQEPTSPTQVPETPQTPLSEAPRASETPPTATEETPRALEGDPDVMSQFRQSAEEPTPFREKVEIEEFNTVVEEELSNAQEATDVLDLISAAEGTDTDDSYNVTLGYGKFLDGAKPDLTNMTLNEVREVQSSILGHSDNNLNSSAVGRYQITRRTLDDLRRQLKLSGDEKFTPELQDKLAETLLQRRGFDKLKSGEISPDEFKRNLVQEWTGFEANPENFDQLIQTLPQKTLPDGTGNTEQFKQAKIGKQELTASPEVLPYADPKKLELSDFSSNPEVAQSEALNVIEQTFVENPQQAVDNSNRLEIAKAFTGFSETNHEQNIALANFIKENAGISINPAQTAWCAAFLDAVLSAEGGQGTGQLNARSYLDWGKEVKTPKPGDVVVFWRESPDSWKGHVGIYLGKDEAGDIKVFGGNQSDAARESVYPAEQVLSYRRG